MGYQLGPPIVDPNVAHDDAVAAMQQSSSGDALGATQDEVIHPRDVIHIREQVVEPRLEDLTARRIFPPGEEADESDQVYLYEEVTREGSARIGGYHDDPPLVDEHVTPRHRIIYPILSGFTFDIDDVRAARDKGRPIRPRKANEARRFVAETENALAFNGHSDYGIEGMSNKTGRISNAVPNGNWSDSATTAADIYDDIRDVWGRQSQESGLTPQVLVVSDTDFPALQKRSDNSDRTVMEMVQDAGMFPRGIFMDASLAAGSLFVLDNRPENMVLEIPRDIDATDPLQKGNWRWQVGVEERTTGLIVFHATAVAEGTGI